MNESNNIIIKQSPSRESLNNLMELFNAERYEDAENLAISILKDFQESFFAWQVLGATYRMTDRPSKSLSANLKAAQLVPEEPTVHNNLGVSFLELNRFKEAKVAFEKAIAIKDNYFQAYNNLAKSEFKLGYLNQAEASDRKAISLNSDYIDAHHGLAKTLQALQRYPEAVTSYNTVLKINPNNVEAYNNFGITLALQNKYTEAEVCYNKAIELKPEGHHAYHNLAGLLILMHRFDEAELKSRKAIALKPDDDGAHYTLANTLTELGRFEEAEASYRSSIELNPDNLSAIINLAPVLEHLLKSEEAITLLKYVVKRGSKLALIANLNLTIIFFQQQKFEESIKFLRAASDLQDEKTFGYINAQVYYFYLSELLKWHENKSIDNTKYTEAKNLYVIGESHCLACNALNLKSDEDDLLARSMLIVGCKQWHLGNSKRNKYKYQFEQIFNSLPKSSTLLLTVGEIDCRLNDGILMHLKKYPTKNIDELVADTVKNYMHYIDKINSKSKHRIIIQGVPCPKVSKKNINKIEVSKLLNVISLLNRDLRNMSKDRSFGFLDVHKLTDDGNGVSNNIWHIDDYHLSPDAILEAWSNYKDNST